MNAAHFDRLARTMRNVSSRRDLVRGLAVAAVLGARRGPDAEAGSKKKNKKNLNLNSFGCVDVGKPCRGKDARCCSGRCQGKKPKKGEKDKSRCVAHHTGGCQAGQDTCLVGQDFPCGTDGFCHPTTGKASFCGVYQFESFNPCTACEKDADCTADFGPGAACIVCPGDCPAPGTTCLSAA